MPNGIWEGMKQAPGLFFGGFNDPNLPEQANEEAQKKAMLMAGLQGMAASRSAPGMPAPGTLQILAQMGMTGQQAGQQFRQQAGVQQALQNPALTQGLNEQQMAALQAMPPEQQAQVLGQLAFAPPPEPQFETADGNLFRINPDGSVTAVHRDTGTTGDWANALARLGHTEESLKALSPQEEAQVRMAAGRLMDQANQARATQVNVDTGEKTGAAINEIVIDEFRNNVEQARAAGQQLRFLNQMELLLENGMTTGRLDQVMKPIREVGAAFGFLSPEEAENLNQQQVFNAIQNRFAIVMRQNMPGQLSDRDVRFLLEQVPRLANTPEGNLRLIQYMKALANRQIEMRNLQRQYLAENQEDPSGWFAYQTNWLEENPLFSAEQSSDAPAQASATAPWNQ